MGAFFVAHLQRQMADATVQFFKLFQQGEQRMVALFAGGSESEQWLENQPFDQVFSSGWHLFAKEALIPVAEARAQGVWLLEAAAAATAPVSARLELPWPQLLRLYSQCADQSLKAEPLAPPVAAEAVLNRVCAVLDAGAARGWTAGGDDSLRIAWHLKRIDALLLRWQGSQELFTGFEIAAAFAQLAQLQWPEAEAETGAKAAHNANCWWNQTVELADARLKQAMAASDWPQALEILELLLNAPQP